MILLARQSLGAHSVDTVRLACRYQRLPTGKRYAARHGVVAFNRHVSALECGGKHCDVPRIIFRIRKGNFPLFLRVPLLKRALRVPRGTYQDNLFQHCLAPAAIFDRNDLIRIVFTRFVRALHLRKSRKRTEKTVLRPAAHRRSRALPGNRFTDRLRDFLPVGLCAQIQTAVNANRLVVPDRTNRHTLTVQMLVRIRGKPLKNKIGNIPRIVFPTYPPRKDARFEIQRAFIGKQTPLVHLEPFLPDLHADGENVCKVDAAFRLFEIFEPVFVVVVLLHVGVEKLEPILPLLRVEVVKLAPIL